VKDQRVSTIKIDQAPDGIGEIKVEYGNPIYPPDFQGLVDGLVRKRLGDACGLISFGVNVVELAPGSATSQKHWHSRQDEFIFVLSGTVQLVTDEFQLDLKPGDFFGFKGGVRNGHHFLNTGEEKAQLLEIGSREPDDKVTYSDIDMVWIGDGAFDVGHFYRKNGTRY